MQLRKERVRGEIPGGSADMGVAGAAASTVARPLAAAEALSALTEQAVQGRAPTAEVAVETAAMAVVAVVPVWSPNLPH
jgi:hypothetical protein